MIHMIPKIQTITPVEILQIIETARDAELRKDTDYLEDIFGTLEYETDITKNFDSYKPEIKAELLRLYGFFLSSYGQAKNKKNYHVKAVDILTAANKIFNDLNDEPKIAESNIQIAFCYWNAGEIDNCEAFLRLSEFDFCGDRQHQVYLRIKISQMMLLCWLRKISNASEIFNELAPLIKSCGDLRLQALFYGEAGILLQIKKKYNEAIIYLNEAVRVNKENGNNLLLALAYNELSLLYQELRLFGDAHLFSDKSLRILQDNGFTGWVPHILDSKALILLEEGNYKDAMLKVEEALIEFYRGEDYKGLVGSLWTRVLCLLRLGMTDDAIFTYGQLQQIATEKLGEATAKRFAADFEREIHPIRNLPLDEEVGEFEKVLIARALIKTDGAKVKAAKLLRLNNHQTLSYILKQRHPDLYVQLGFPERCPRGSSDGQKNNRKYLQTKSIKLRSKEEFLHIDLDGKVTTFDFKSKPPKFEAYFFDERLMSGFGIDSSAIVAVRNISKLKDRLAAVVLHDGQVTVSNIIYDSELDLHLIYDENGEPVFFEEENVIGEPFGFCLLDDVLPEAIHFSKL